MRCGPRFVKPRASNRTEAASERVLLACWRKLKQSQPVPEVQFGGALRGSAAQSVQITRAYDCGEVASCIRRHVRL